MKRTIVITLAAALLLVAAAAPAADARSKHHHKLKRIVPKGFYGLNWDQDIKRFASFDFRKKQWYAMRKNGAETVRSSIDWAFVEPDQYQQPDWTETDRLVTLASAYGLELVPIVNTAPPWANGTSDAYFVPDIQKFDDWLKTLIARYGPHGQFWNENPNLPYKPIRKWQIWNEPNVPGYFDVPKGDDWAVRYGELLRSAYTTVKAADRGAKVLAAGLAGYSWTDFDRLEKVGKIHGYFDIADVHPYTSKLHGPLQIVRLFRKAMKANGDAKRDLWVGELGLPSSKGKTHDTSTLQTTDKGMAAFLNAGYSDLVKYRKRAASRVSRVYWYTWASIYYGDIVWHWSGLVRWDKGKNDDFVTPRPALKVYRKHALHDEGVKR